MTTTHKWCGPPVEVMIPESNGFVQRFTSVFEDQDQLIGKVPSPPQRTQNFAHLSRSTAPHVLSIVN
jgi:hypothetical protein